MRQWFRVDEIAAAAQGELPGTVRGLNLIIARDGWRASPHCRKGDARGFEYHVSLLPKPVQIRLQAEPLPLPEAAESQLWQAFNSLPDTHKAEAAKRLAALETLAGLRSSGMAETAAGRRAARDSGVSLATLYNWRSMVSGLSRADWLAALAPNHGGGRKRSACDPDAYAVIKSDFLRPEEPTFTACYRRLEKLAKASGWVLPEAAALRRHLDKDVPRAVQVMLRQGRDAARTLYPAQTRTRAHFRAMAGVNMDGHKFDVFVKTADGRVIRPMLVGIQDLYSGKILAWRLAESENKDMVRLVIGDMVERHGIPDAIWLDNGRAFASKWITGGVANRFRFKVKDEDPQGLLTALGVKVHWTTPYSGQSKPIERAWGELAQITRHPFCAGAHTGNAPDAKPENYGSRAVDFTAFKAFVDQEVLEHNARPGRDTETANGRSFDETFAASIADPATIVAWPTSAQKALWLMAAERIRTSKANGEIAFMGNRYWDSKLTGHAGQYVTVRFDPDRLMEPLRVYDGQGKFLCAAAAIARTGFDDVDAARSHARNRKAYVNAVKAQADLHARLSAEELARLYASGAEALSPKTEKPAVTRLAGLPANEKDPDWGDDEERAFSRGLRIVASR